jgi:hypothetical protein
MLALKSGEMAADVIHDALAVGDVSGTRLGAFGGALVSGMQTIRRLVYAFYDPSFSFAAFRREHPQYHDHLVRILIGDVFNDEVPRIFEAMRGSVDLPAGIELSTAASVE